MMFNPIILDSIAVIGECAGKVFPEYIIKLPVSGVAKVVLINQPSIITFTPERYAAVLWRNVTITDTVLPT